MSARPATFEEVLAVLRGWEAERDARRVAEDDAFLAETEDEDVLRILALGRGIAKLAAARHLWTEEA